VSPEPPEPADPDVARRDAAPRRRGYRRATGGTAPAGTQAPTTPGRAPDDTDVGWNEPGRDDDERILREKPPHW